MRKPATFYRETVAEMEMIPETHGIYILAYMGEIVYVGKAEISIHDRLRGHFTNSLNEPLGAWLRKVDGDWENIRLDVLVPPAGHPTWLQDVERQLIAKFRPLFNIQLNT